MFAVTTDSAAFFRHGPQQGREPDIALPKDTMVKLIRPSFGYSKVELVTSGEKGYVSSEDIKPASGPLLAAANTPSARQDSITTPHAGRPAAEQFNIDSNDPRLIPPPEQLPDPDLPAPSPEPEQ